MFGAPKRLAACSLGAAGSLGLASERKDRSWFSQCGSFEQVKEMSILPAPFGPNSERVGKTHRPSPDA